MFHIKWIIFLLKLRNQVTANNFESQIDKGNNAAMMKASNNASKVTAQAASIKIKEITPAFTAPPIFFPMGFLMALDNGLNIIQAKGKRKSSDHNKRSFVKLNQAILPITTAYKTAAR